MHPAPPGPSGTHLRPGHVLVIDGEAFLGDALQRALGDEHQIVAVPEAAEALERLRRGERYDVVLCDLMMPRKAGIDFHRRLLAALPRFDRASGARR